LSQNKIPDLNPGRIIMGREPDRVGVYRVTM